MTERLELGSCIYTEKWQNVNFYCDKYDSEIRMGFSSIFWLKLRKLGWGGFELSLQHYVLQMVEDRA